MKEALIFDFDGTIADDIEILLEILRDQINIRSKRNITLDYINTFRDSNVDALINDLELSQSELIELVSDIFLELNRKILSVEPIKGMKHVLSQLKAAGRPLGIITTNERKNVELFLKKHNISIFDYLITDTPIFGKDKIITQFLVDENLKSDDILYIGDEVRDIDAAKKIGVRIASVSWGYNTRESLEKHRPNYIFLKPEELVKALA